jgi:hypothetical protein
MVLVIAVCGISALALAYLTLGRRELAPVPGE